MAPPSHTQLQTPFVEEFLKHTATSCAQVLSAHKRAVINYPILYVMMTSLYYRTTTYSICNDDVTVLQSDNLAVLNLLWKYYEKNKNYEAAARILDTLAHREG